jgi:uncharacterized integral membrane protein
MIGKVLRLAILIPLAIVLVLFAVANRHSVSVSFDPFNSVDPASAAAVPLFVLIFVLVILGVLVGGTAVWVRQGRWRRSTHRLEAENRALHDELYELKRYYVAHEGAPAASAAEAPPLALRAPVE